jgi:hypothetical protein
VAFLESRGPNRVSGTGVPALRFRLARNLSVPNPARVEALPETVAVHYPVTKYDEYGWTIIGKRKVIGPAIQRAAMPALAGAEVSS